MTSRVPLAFVLGAVATAALLAAVPLAAGTASVKALRMQGDVEADFGTGALLLPGLGGGDAALTLDADRVEIRYVQEEWFAAVEFAPGESLLDVEVPPGALEEDADRTETFYGASLSLERFRDADVLVFSAWDEQLARSSFRVTGEDSEGVLTPVGATRLVDVPKLRGSDDPAFPEDRQFVYDVPTGAFEWQSAAATSRPTATATGEFSFYVYGADVLLEADDGTSGSWETGYRQVEPHGAAPTTPVGRAAYTDRYSFVVATVYGATLEVVAAPQKLAWFSPDPQVRVLGTVDSPPVEGEEGTEVPESSNGELLVQAHYTDAGAEFQFVQPDLETAAAAPSPSPGLAPTPLLVGLAVAALALLVAVFFVIRWYAWSRFVPAPPVRAPLPSGNREPAPLPPAVTATAAPPAPAPPRSAPHVALVRSALPGETTKEAVLRLIEKRPGVHLSGLAGDLGIHRSLAFHHVRDLVRKGLVYAIPLGGKHALFRAGAIDPAAARGLAAVAAPRTAAVADLLFANPGITIQRVADALAMSPRSSARELQRLRSAGLALRDMLANPARFHPSELLKKLHAGDLGPAVELPVLGTNGHTSLPSPAPAMTPFPNPF